MTQLWNTTKSLSLTESLRANTLFLSGKLSIKIYSVKHAHGRKSADLLGSHLCCSWYLSIFSEKNLMRYVTMWLLMSGSLYLSLWIFNFARAAAASGAPAGVADPVLRRRPPRKLFNFRKLVCICHEIHRKRICVKDFGFALRLRTFVQKILT